MPTYEYRRADGTVFEVFQGINDPALTHCPDTDQPVQRIITGGGGVVYKGSGWYVTDYKNGAGKNGAGGNAGGDAGRSAGAAGAATAATGTNGNESASASSTGSEAGSAGTSKEPSSGTSS
jgi:putative FmdB family regulatory protein